MSELSKKLCKLAGIKPKVKGQQWYFDDWDSEEIMSREGNRLVLDEWVGTKEVENFMEDEPYSAFTLIIKHVDYDDLDFEPEEPNY